MVKNVFLALIALTFSVLAQAQYSALSINNYMQDGDSIEHVPDDWYHLDLQKDGMFGTSVEKAYRELLKDKKSKPIIVAIIDSGVDIEHEDLKDNLWTNTKEISGNGDDDDKNGYIDDIHGWNFIGGADGKMVDHDNLEFTRLYGKYKKIYGGKSVFDFKGKQLQKYKDYRAIEEHYLKKVKEAEGMVQILKNIVVKYEEADSILRKALKKDEYTYEEVQSLENVDNDVKMAKNMLSELHKQGIGGKDLKESYDHYKDKLDYSLNTSFNSRNIVGDDYDNKKERNYGNSKVQGVNPIHGTHVAGIVGANRNNNIGIKGIADNVKLMVIRAVPGGDERDKDVANSIYYAVNNGAKIINMSFGKDYSPSKKYVDKAVRYAEKKGVLLVHAAGNDGRNTDSKMNYPHPKYLKKNKWAKNWIEVGASSWTKNENLPAPFSNYGKRTVSLFAPGVEIYSTIPGNKYKKLQGTSMASPVVAGVAALLWSYFPQLKAQDVKKILMESSIKYANGDVIIPGEKDKITKFSNLSQSSGVVNAYNAIKMAENYKK